MNYIMQSNKTNLILTDIETNFIKSNQSHNYFDGFYSDYVKPYLGFYILLIIFGLYLFNKYKENKIYKLKLEKYKKKRIKKILLSRKMKNMKKLQEFYETRKQRHDENNEEQDDDNFINQENIL